MRTRLHRIRAWPPPRPLLLLGALLAVFAITSAGASGAINTVTYHAGWNLAGGSEGTRYAGADGSLYTLQPGDDSYEVFPAGTAALSGHGYWVYFGAARTVQLPDGLPFVTVELPPGQWVLVGNPSGFRTAPVSGADALFTFDPGRGYIATASLLPGQGALAYSQNGGLLIIGTPDSSAAENEPESGDIPAGPVGSIDDGGCRTGDVLAGVYHPSRLQVIEACRTATGRVASVRVEADGDYHVNVLLDPGQDDLLNKRNLTIQHGGLVAEVIPADQRQAPPPLQGERVQVTGAFVLDREHGWLELHPAWRIVPAPR